MKMYKLAIAVVSVFVAFVAQAQQIEETPDSTFTIVEVINNGESGIYIIQPLELNRIVQHLQGGSMAGSKEANHRVGYRIQIYSDNNVRTARSTAETRKRQIEEFLPGMRGYLTYQSPYWRVRFGDFTSYSEAEAYMREIKSAFPQYANDMRIVKEPINHLQY